MKIEDIHKHVTHFSSQLKDGKHTEEVVIGGQITNVIPPLSDDFPMYIIIVDDYIDTISVYVDTDLFDKHEERFTEGSFVFFEGFLNLITREIKTDTIKDVSVFAYSLKEVPILEESML